jgi:hypothetical protein
MIYDKTLLYSATATTSTITLPEPLSAFERYVVKVSPGVYWESVCTGDRSVQRYNRYASYNNDGYMEWPANWVISNGTKTMTCNRFQLLMQLNTANKTQTFGWNNTAGNIKNISEVWGINRKEHIETEGAGKPEGEGWHAYDETLLWSGTDYANQSHIDLSGRALEYERLKIGVGSFGESTNIYDVDAPQSYTSWLPLRSYWGTTTGSFYLSMHRYRWDNETSGLSAVSGKTWQLGTGAANPFSTTGNYTATDPHIRRPVWAIWGVNHKKPYKFIAVPSEGGTVSSDRVNGYENDIGTITVTPAGDEWRQSALNITGATLTGNDFMFENSNVTAQAEFEHSRDLTLVNSEHGTLSADKMSGFSGDVVTVDATTDEGWYLSAIALTGAEATGFKFMFTGSDVTAQGEYTDVGFPVTYLNDEHVQCTGDAIFIPGNSGITLETGYDPYYRISGYEVENGTIENGVLIPTGPCTVKAVQKVNYFTATGNFEKGSDVVANGNNAANPGIYQAKWTYSNVPAKYALHQSHTGDISTAWYSTSNRWKPNDASAYSITLNTKCTFTAGGGINGQSRGATAVSLLGSTQTQSQTFASNNAATWNYSKSVTTTSQNILYGLSGRVGATKYMDGAYVIRVCTATYVANNTTGTWTATGIAP